MLIIFNIIFIAFIGAIVVYIRQYRIKKRAHIKELEDVDAMHKEELLRTQVEIQMQTMKHIGSEIHDNVGQKLTLSSLYLQQIPLGNLSSEVSTNIKSIGNIIDESLEDLRQLSKSLTDDTIQNKLLSELLKNECDRVNELSGVKIFFKNASKATSISYEVKSVLLRITQEFIQNSIKHADCKNINVLLSAHDGLLQLRLEDDGKGFDTEKVNGVGIGLNNIKRRVNIIKGTFKLHSNEGKGTRLIIEIRL